MLNAIFTVLFIALWTPTFGCCCSMSHVRELRVSASLASSPYAGPLDTLGLSIRFSGAFIGAVSRNFPVPATIPGAFTLDRTGNPSNYLAVIAYTNSTSEGDAALLQILNPGDPNVPFVSLVVGVLDCNTAAFPNFVNPLGNPRSVRWVPPRRAPHSWLGSNYVHWRVRGIFFRGAANRWPFWFRNAFGRDVLAPVWSQHSLFMVQDLTHNYLAATPDPDIYASSNGGVVVEEVVSLVGSLIL
ncbi:hypothetical protein B0H14DRAFT_2977737 [Mycena olivaceomarginata]|nr:hypothetical protein B0H14DRAFT_2977737 [Mycena olivaceomarginata]